MVKLFHKFLFANIKSGVIGVWMLILGQCSWAQNSGVLPLSVLCSVQTEYCKLLAQTYERQMGVKVNIIKKGSAEALAQLIAQQDNPKVDVWFGGTGEPHLLAAELKLTQEYQSPLLTQLHSWAQSQAKLSNYRTVGIYTGPLGIGYNVDWHTQHQVLQPTSWTQLLNPIYKEQLQIANPAYSGTAYTMIATLVQLMGEDKAFEYMRTLVQNAGVLSKSGSIMMRNVAQGKSAATISFTYDIEDLKKKGLNVHAVYPSEGTGLEVGSMSIVHNAKNLAEAQKFYDWALSPQGQMVGIEAKNYQIPSNKGSRLHPFMPDLSKVKLIHYDFAKYGLGSERIRLMNRWAREMRSLNLKP